VPNPAIAITQGAARRTRSRHDFRVLAVALCVDDGAVTSGCSDTGRRPASASANSVAVAKRSAGTFASARITAASMCSGTVSRVKRMVCGRSCRTLAMIACTVLPACGGSPVSISYATAPNE
jgi:hypothetical protein